MHLQELKLTNFKNYEFQSLAFSPRLNLVAGDNGMGKTNLLDAVYYLCMGKSYFQGMDRHVVRHGEAFFRLEARFSLGEKQEKIVAKVVPGKPKVLERNDVPYGRISEHTGLLPVVFMTPDDTRLALEGSEERRRFLDNTLCQTDRRYLDSLITYNAVLESRNALLRQFAQANNFNPTLLEAYDRQLTGPARYIAECRRDFLAAFSPVFNEYYAAICGGVEVVNCSYRSQLLEADLADLLAASLDKDRVLQRTTQGVHRDDLSFDLNEQVLKRFASQGQLKSFVLALKLAQSRYLLSCKGLRPILLLDDLFDKLDDHRVLQLIELLLRGEFGQVFISDTHPERSVQMAARFDSDYKKFIIANGTASLS